MCSLAGAGAGLYCASMQAEEPGPGLNEPLLDEVARRGTMFFWEMADPNTGLVLDKASVEEPYRPGVSSIAATGFGLSALCIGDARGYLNRDEARARVHRTLEFLNTSVEHEHGFFYHFLYSSTGRRVWKSEASSIDTGWLLCGALHCRTYWDDPAIKTLASKPARESRLEVDAERQQNAVAMAGLRKPGFCLTGGIRMLNCWPCIYWRSVRSRRAFRRRVGTR